MKAFISHSSKDKPFVERLATDLRTREGIDAWLDKWEILPGDRIPEKLEEGLANAGIFLLILSPDSVNSQWVSYERDAWLTAQVDEEVRARQESRTPSRRLIPVLYKDCEKPFFLQSFLHVSINDRNYEEGFQQLVRGMRGESGKPPLKSKTTTAPVPSSTTGQASSGVAPRILAFNLLKQLYFYYNIRNGEFPPDENKMRDILVGMLSKPVSQESKRLVIVLDGLDEADKTFEPFFTLLPAGVFVIASARAEEGDEPKYLRNWTDNAQRLHLKRLPREAIPKWLEQISELAAYSEDEEFIRSLDKTTGGFPLYLRFLIDDLREAVTQSQDVREVLAQTPEGFEGYVEQQLERLDELARNQKFVTVQRKYLPDELDLPLKTVRIALRGKAETDDAGGMAEFLLLHAGRLMQTITRTYATVTSSEATVPRRAPRN